MGSEIRFNGILNKIFSLDKWEYAELNILLSTIKIYSMKKNEIEKREQLSKELEMSFDETLELFSEETLGTMMMTEVVGGSGSEGFNFVCRNTNCRCKTLNKSFCDTKDKCKPY